MLPSTVICTSDVCHFLQLVTSALTKYTQRDDDGIVEYSSSAMFDDERPSVIGGRRALAARSVLGVSVQKLTII